MGDGSRLDTATYAAWANGADVPGTAYEALLPIAARRPQGQFQTPLWATDFMGQWLLAEPTRTLFDPAVGSGRLLYRPLEVGQYTPKRLVGWDIDELSAAMAALNLRLRRVANYTITVADFLLDDDRLRHDGLVETPPDATIANPPFCRHQALDAEMKKALHLKVEEQTGLRISRRAGLHALFLVRALALAAPDGRLAFVTPAGWFDADYGEAIKRYVAQRASVEAIVHLGGRRDFFDSVQTTAAITLLRKDTEERPTRIVRLGARRPPVVEVLAAVRGEAGRIKAHEIELHPDARWSRSSVRLPTKGTPLSEVARVRRGVATGFNRFFVLSEATRRDWGLGRRLMRPCLYRPRYIDGTEVTRDDLESLDEKLPRWLLRPPTEQRDNSDDPLGRYLTHGREELAVHQRHLTSHRKPWFKVEERGRCKIVLPYMNLDDARFIRNRANAVPLNNFHAIEPKRGIDADELWVALNAEPVLRQLRRLGREYGRGLWKIEPGALCQVRVELGSSVRASI
jgi:adenine-specific DNA-methyltransferase